MLVSSKYPTNLMVKGVTRKLSSAQFLRYITPQVWLSVGAFSTCCSWSLTSHVPPAKEKSAHPILAQASWISNRRRVGPSHVHTPASDGSCCWWKRVCGFCLCAISPQISFQYTMSTSEDSFRGTFSHRVGSRDQTQVASLGEQLRSHLTGPLNETERVVKTPSFSPII